MSVYKHITFLLNIRWGFTKTLLILLLGITVQVSAQNNQVLTDTLTLNLKDAEDMFIKNNYLLLAQKFNIDAGKSLARQAGLFNNPNIYYENSIYNRYNQKYFPRMLGQVGEPSTQGEYIIQFNWLMSIAGKRNKAVKVAQAQAASQQYQFDDLIRTLLFSLRSDFYTLKYSLESLSIYQNQINTLKNTVQQFEIQFSKGNVSLRELTRVRALLLSLESDKLALISDIQSIQSEMSQLLNTGKIQWYKPNIDENELLTKYITANLNLSDLMNEALNNRPDLKVAQADLNASEANIKYQKAVGFPDITLQGVIDRNGSYIPNYNGAAIAMPLVIFNRNQGNVSAAKYQNEAMNMQLKQKMLSVQNDVLTSYRKIIETDQLYQNLNKQFESDFGKILSGAKENFEKKNMSLLEFVDLFETYKQSITNLNDIKSRRLNAFEELNYNVGKDVFKK